MQLYVRDLVSSVTRPVRELKGFVRVTLDPGETREVELEITPERLAYWNIDKECVVEPGEFDLYVGFDSTAGRSVRLRATKPLLSCANNHKR